MGKNSKARRDAKAKARARGATSAHGSRSQTTDPFGFSTTPPPPPPLPELWEALAYEDEMGKVRRPDFLHSITRYGARADQAAQEVLIGQVGHLWAHGWQPREAHRQVRRLTTARSAGLIDLAIHADHARRAGQAIDPRWSVQLQELGQRESSTRGPWLAEWRERHGLDVTQGAEAVLATLRAVMFVPALDELIPRPGSTGKATLGDLGSSGVDSHPMLDRIRKLLAKAESSEFEAEAAAFSGKAQELMTRHAIDVALIPDPDDDQTPRMIRVPVDAPYADAKSYLLGVVAVASRSRTVWLKQVAMSSVVGMADDLRGVELLFTSLLVQAQHALVDPQRRTAPGARSRQQGYRSAFLLAFAHRIAERLEAANEQVIADAAESSSSFLPVLAARESAVEDFVESHFGELTQGTIRGGYDAAGAAHGREAADAARLRAGELPH